MDTVNLTPVLNALTQIATIVVLAIVPVLLSRALDYARQHLHLKITDQQIQQVSDEADTVAGVVLQKLSAKTMDLAEVHVHNPAMQVLAAGVLDRAYDATNHLGLNKDNVSAMIVAKVFALVAADPTMPTIQPVKAPVPVPMGPVSSDFLVIPAKTPDATPEKVP